MSIKALVLAAAAVTSVALPAAARAQRYGGYGYDAGYSGYQDGYRGDGYRGDHYRDDRARDRWERRQWEARRRYEEAQRRRWASQHRHDHDGGYRYDRAYPY